MQYPSLSDALLLPALSLIPQLDSHLPDLVYSDDEFTRLGLRRVLQSVQSGRDFLQHARSSELSDASVRAYFGALSSARRCSMLTELNKELLKQARLANALPADRLGDIPELQGRGIIALDGHVITHATHAEAETTAKGRRLIPPSRGIFWRDLRNDSAGVLVQTEGHEHEWAAVKRTAWENFPGHGQPRTLLIIDSVAVDFAFLRAAKHGGGFFVITRFKDGLKARESTALPWNQSDRRNAGVLSDERVRFDSPGEFRRIRYLDPETGTEFEFLTTDFTLPPGIVALLYRRRWDIEKLFDVFENKLNEAKAWAVGPIPARVQSEFLVLLFNLALLLRTRLESQDGIRDAKAEDKYAARLKEREIRAEANGCTISPWVKALYIRPTQLSCQFLRWLRDAWQLCWEYNRAVAYVRPLMKAYMR